MTFLSLCLLSLSFLASLLLYPLPLSFFSLPHTPLSSFFSTASTFTTLLGGFQSACCDCAIGAVLGLVGGSKDLRGPRPGTIKEHGPHRPSSIQEPGEAHSRNIRSKYHRKRRKNVPDLYQERSQEDLA
ncbi:MAG: hypothetical protein J3R72DRAFT_417564 [Linnemannia gamsii]|nr:MAG: hypothetical protein J3R72DRAFT_417564 [Linnemannia gamsii]